MRTKSHHCDKIRVDVRIIQPVNLKRVSTNDPDVLYISYSPAGYLARAGMVVKVAPESARMIIALVARPGHIISKDEMIDLLYGEREDGGPEDKTLDAIWMRARIALTALGYYCERQMTRGFMARPVIFVDHRTGELVAAE